MFIYTGSIRYVACGDESSPLHLVYRILGDTIQPHRLYLQRSRNGTQAVPYGFAGGWILSTAQVVFATWRAADCRPYRRGTIQPHVIYSQRSRNGTQAVPYGFADWCYFLTNVFQKRPRPSPITVNCQLSTVNLNQLSIVNCQFPNTRSPAGSRFRLWR